MNKQTVIIPTAGLGSRMGNYTKHYDEYRNNLNIQQNGDANELQNQLQNASQNASQEIVNINNSNLYRYNKKEEHIQHTIKFLNDVISQIKNDELSNPLNKEHIRQQYRTFLQYGENIKLFKTLSINTREIANFARLIKSKHKYIFTF
jgi:hypothetical protein